MESKLTKLISLIFILLLIGCVSGTQEEENIKVEYEIPSHLSKQETSYFLIGHAETGTSNPDDHTELSGQGFEQAAFWGDFFSDKELDLFYTTTETFAFQTMIPIVHPYKGQVNNLEDKLTFDREFWRDTYGQKVVIVSYDQHNTDFVNDILQHNKYRSEDLTDKNYLIRLDIDIKRQVKDTLIKF